MTEDEWGKLMVLLDDVVLLSNDMADDVAVFKDTIQARKEVVIAMSPFLPIEQLLNGLREYKVAGANMLGAIRGATKAVP